MVANNQNQGTTDLSYIRLAGLTATAGSVIMIIGAILFFSSGFDLWAAVDSDGMGEYLAGVNEVKTQLIANLSIWIIGVLVLGIAWYAIVQICTQRPVLGSIAGLCAAASVPIVVISYIMMMSVLVKIAPDTSDTSIAIANVVGWIGIRADDLGTTLIIGLAPFFVSLAARDEWLPKWLVLWGYVAGVVGVLSLLVRYIPSLSEYGIIIVPVGVLWMLSTGIVLLRR